MFPTKYVEKEYKCFERAKTKCSKKKFELIVCIVMLGIIDIVCLCVCLCLFISLSIPPSLPVHPFLYTPTRRIPNQSTTKEREKKGGKEYAQAMQSSATTRLVDYKVGNTASLAFSKT